MILTVVKTSGERLDVALEAERGDGLTLLVDGFSEKIPLTQLTGLELQQSDATPVLMARFGDRFLTPYPCWPSSTLRVGWEDTSAAELSNKHRSVTFVVGELASVLLDMDRITIPQPQEVT